MSFFKSLVLIFCFLFHLAACSGTSTTSNSANNDSNSGSNNDTGDDSSAAGDSSGGTNSRGLSAPAADSVTHTGSFPNSTGWFNATLAISGRSTEGAEQISVYRPSATTNLPLVIFFPGTGDNVSVMKDALSGESGIESVFSSSENAIFVMAPRAYQSDLSGDWDHNSDSYYWNTTTDNADTNPDLLLVRAIIQEARDQYNINASRVYLMGHSSGGFFAEFAAMLLKDRIAGFAENAAGYVSCFPSSSRKADTQPAFGTTNCSTILSTAGSDLTCNSGNTEPFSASALPSSASQRVPAYLRHEISDTVVSVYNSCYLSSALVNSGYTQGSNLSTNVISDGSGHSVDVTFLSSAWSFLRAFTL